MVEYMKVNLKMIRSMVMVNTFGKNTKNIEDGGMKVSSMVLEYTQTTKLNKLSLDFIKWERESGGSIEKKLKVFKQRLQTMSSYLCQENLKIRVMKIIHKKSCIVCIRKLRDRDQLRLVEHLQGLNFQKMLSKNYKG